MKVNAICTSPIQRGCKNLFQNGFKNCTKSLKNTLQKLKPKKETLPIVSEPILLYMQTKKEAIAKKIAKEADNVSDKHFTKEVEKSTKALKDAGVKGDYTKYIDQTTGRLNLQGQNKCPNFKGLDDHNPDLEAQLSALEHELAGLDAEHAQIVSDSASAQNAIESGLIDELGLDEILNHISDHPGVAVATGVAAELLPGTRFLKPVKDLFSGDVEKAIAGGATRLGEIALGPLKLLWAGGTGLIGGVMGLFRPDDEELGFWKCFKYASESWAKGRDNLENVILGRETSGEKKKRLKKEAKDRFDSKLRRVEEEKEKIRKQKLQLETQEKERKLEQLRRLEEIERIEEQERLAQIEKEEKERARKREMKAKAKRNDPIRQKKLREKQEKQRQIEEEHNKQVLEANRGFYSFLQQQDEIRRKAAIEQGTLAKYQVKPEVKEYWKRIQQEQKYQAEQRERLNQREQLEQRKPYNNLNLTEKERDDLRREEVVKSGWLKQFQRKKD